MSKRPHRYKSKHDPAALATRDDDAYRALWCAVFVQALNDSHLTSERYQRERNQARAWLERGNSNSDFTTVSLLAGFDPCYTQEKVAMALKSMKEQGGYVMPCKKKKGGGRKK